MKGAPVHSLEPSTDWHRGDTDKCTSSSDKQLWNNSITAVAETPPGFGLVPYREIVTPSGPSCCPK